MCMIFLKIFKWLLRNCVEGKFQERRIEFYAVKSISKSNLSQKSLKNLICEIQILAKLDHPNIVSKKHLEEKDAAEILFKLTHAISHCHSRGIVHRDIKAENILFEIKTKSKNDVKIIDFGLARKKVTHNLHSIVG